jgi:hypothetical protein
MKTSIQLYQELEQVVTKFYYQLRLDKLEKHKGRKLAITIIQSVSLGLFKQLNGIPTKKAIFNIFRPKCVYKTLVENLNRWAIAALLILKSIMLANRQNSHIVKHTDSTDIPVCLNKNANTHKVMHGLAAWSKNGKGWYFGLKMHLTTDLHQHFLNVKFSSASVADATIFMQLNKEISGLFVADAAYIGQELAKLFHQTTGGFLFAKPRRNMKKLMTDFQFRLYNTRMLIEINFRNLKAFHNLVTSIPRSVSGYFANYIYSVLAYQFS